MKGWINLALMKLREAYNCDHTVGICWDHDDTELVKTSTVTDDEGDRFLKFLVRDVEFFFYCPDCGERLNMKEKYKDAVEMVQMPQ